MERRSDGVVYVALVVAVIALIVSALAYAGRPRPPASAPARPPATLKLSMVVATFTGQGMAAHRWYPTMLVAREGDTIDLAVANPDTVNHQLELTGYNLRTKILTPGSTDSLRFVADHTGVFAFQCILPYDPAKHNCTPDHELMRGYLIVTE
jgi:heme/copper-type cytochrome/quinol oxidase subunit 2